MLIAYNGADAKEIRPGVTVWISADDTFLNLDDGKRYPQFVAITEPAEVEPHGHVLVSHFYELMGRVHPHDREETNKMKVSRVWYQSIKLTLLRQDGTPMGANDPRDPSCIDTPIPAKRSAKAISPYLWPEEQKAAR